MIGAVRPFPESWIAPLFIDGPSPGAVATPVGMVCPKCKVAIAAGDFGIFICVGESEETPSGETVLHRACWAAIVVDLNAVWEADPLPTPSAACGSRSDE